MQEQLETVKYLYTKDEANFGEQAIFSTAVTQHLRANEQGAAVQPSPHRTKLEASTTMQNEEGVNVDLYVPRKCSYTNRLIESKDHASVQINVATVDPATGVATGEHQSYALAGYIRFKSEADMALTTLVKEAESQ